MSTLTRIIATLAVTVALGTSSSLVTAQSTLDFPSWQAEEHGVCRIFLASPEVAPQAAR